MLSRASSSVELIRRFSGPTVPSEQIRISVPELKAGPEGKSIRLPEIREITDETVALLATAFSRSKPESLLLPVVPVKGGDPQ